MNFEKFTIHKLHSTKTKILTDPVIRNAVNLEIFLEYELVASSRYRRYVSVVMMKGVGNGSSHFKDLLSDSIRSCDASFAYGNYMAVLMGETDEQGSNLAIERYKKSLNCRQADIQFASVTYPKDGRTVEDLHSILLQRIEN